jgi:hypothetical protein
MTDSVPNFTPFNKTITVASRASRAAVPKHNDKERSMLFIVYRVNKILTIDILKTIHPVYPVMDRVNISKPYIKLFVEENMLNRCREKASPILVRKSVTYSRREIFLMISIGHGLAQRPVPSSENFNPLIIT